MSQTTTVPTLVNQTMKFFLRSPMHGLVSQTVLLVTFTGRKSGKTYTTPVSYTQSGEQVTVFTHATWWKNLLNNALVSLRIRGRELQGWAEPVDGDKHSDCRSADGASASGPKRRKVVQRDLRRPGEP